MTLTDIVCRPSPNTGIKKNNTLGKYSDDQKKCSGCKGAPCNIF